MRQLPACLASWPAEVLVTRPVLEGTGEPEPIQFSVQFMEIL